MTIAVLRRAAVAVSVLAAVVLPGSLPAQAAGTGTLTGTVTNPNGTPAANISITAYLDKSGVVEGVAWAQTDTQGRYKIIGLDAGSYAVSFDPLDGPEQFYRQKFDLWSANRITLASGATATVNDQLLPIGAITGRILDTAGTPVENLMVRARDVQDFKDSWAITDAEGNYRIGVFPGTYTVSFEPIPDVYQTQFVPGKVSEEDATIFPVTAGAEVVANDTLLPAGTLAGRFTTAAGAPLAGADVSMETRPWSSGVWATTDGDGRFSTPILAGTYLVAFGSEQQSQYYKGALTEQDATPVTVVGGQRVEITDSLLPTGSVRFTAVDSVTGAKVTSFCIEEACSDSTGTATLTRPQGSNDFFNVYALDHLHFQTDVKGVAVVGGQTVDVTVRMRPGAAITATVVSRSTNNPVTDICLLAVRPRQVNEPDGYGDCSDSTGKVTVGPLEPGTYRVMADTRRNPTWGRQWVGASGGTGDERLAATVTATVGKIVAAPQVRLDPAGKITGTVTSAASGLPVGTTGVSLLPGYGGADETYTDNYGTYVLTGLGPYEWPLLFGDYHYNFPDQWSGGVSSRYRAKKIKVTSGATTHYDMALRAGTTVRGTVKDQNGVLPASGRIAGHNAETGDVMGRGYVDGGSYRMLMLPTLSIYVRYDVEFGTDDRYYHGQYPTNPLNPGVPLSLKEPYRQKVTVPSTGELVLDCTVRR